MMANNQSVKETPEELRHTDEQHNQEITPVSYTHLTLPTILRV